MARPAHGWVLAVAPAPWPRFPDEGGRETTSFACLCIVVCKAVECTKERCFCRLECRSDRSVSRHCHWETRAHIDTTVPDAPWAGGSTFSSHDSTRVVALLSTVSKSPLSFIPRASHPSSPRGSPGAPHTQPGCLAAAHGTLADAVIIAISRRAETEILSLARHHRPPRPG